MNKVTISRTCKKMIADIHTPVSLYLKLRDEFPNALLLESADYHDRSDSMSFICLEVLADFEASGTIVKTVFPGEKLEKKNVGKYNLIWAELQKFMHRFEPEDDEISVVSSGFWGYSSFEAVQYMEDIQFRSKGTRLKDNPDLKYQFFKYILIYDHFKNEISLVTHFLDDDKEDHSDEILGIIQVTDIPYFTFQSIGEESSNISDVQYREMVTSGKLHCQRGDTFQLVLSREFQQKFRGDEFNVYRALRSINPSPYLFYFDYGNFKIMGSSPESQLQISDGNASINPIAGTVLRGDTQEEDKERAKALSTNAKEMSEHVMLVDLARNDLSKKSSHVEVKTYAEVQYFSHVIHLVSKVTGKLESGSHALQIYADTFPAGTLSGAPKYRALQLIDKYESVDRNFYGGAIGFLGFDGSINHAIIIRSLLSKNNTLVYQAGAGIVSESTPEGELQEVFNKIAALRMAIKKGGKL